MRFKTILSIFTLIVICFSFIIQPVSAANFSDMVNKDDKICEVSVLVDLWCSSTGDTDRTNFPNIKQHVVAISTEDGDWDGDGYNNKYESEHPKRSIIKPESKKTYDVNNNGIRDNLDYETGISLDKDYSQKKDTDGDGLSNIEEESIGTNPNKKDTDNDGYNDKVEIIEPGPLSNMSALYKDVFFEIDSLSQKSSTLSAPSRLSEWANIPNPSEKSGFKIHKIPSDKNLLEVDETLNPSQLNRYGATVQREHHDYKKYGTIQVVLVKKIHRLGDKYGGWVFYRNTDLFFIATEYSGSRSYVHEFGHLTGIKQDYTARAVDSEDYTHSEYPSIMNYNYDYNSDATYPIFSNGENGRVDHDDIEHIEEYFDSQNHAINQEYN